MRAQVSSTNLAVPGLGVLAALPALFAFAAGHLALLPALVLCASFVVQTHVAVVPVAAVALALSGVVAVRSAVRRAA